MKKFTYILLAMISFFLNSCIELENDLTIRDLVFSEGDPMLAQAKNYNYYMDKKENILNEDFLNNSRNWPINNTSTNNYRKIENGLYKLAKTSTSILQTNTTGNTLIPIGFNNNFEIEIRVKAYLNENEFYTAENATYTVGFSQNYSSLNFISDVEVTVNKTNLKINTINANSITENINNNDSANFNLLTLRKVNNYLIVFLNGVYVKHTPITTFNTNYFKFLTTKEAQIDYIKYFILTN